MERKTTTSLPTTKEQLNFALKLKAYFATEVITDTLEQYCYKDNQMDLYILSHTPHICSAHTPSHMKCNDSKFNYTATIHNTYRSQSPCLHVLLCQLKSWATQMTPYNYIPGSQNAVDDLSRSIKSIKS